MDVVDIISRNANELKDSIAVIEGKDNISYSHFFRRCCTISKRLLELSHTLRPKVIVDLDQGVDSYALIVAILKIGGTWCPLNTIMPTERKRHIVKEFKPDLIVTKSLEKIDFNTKKESVVTIDSLLKESDFSVKQNTSYNDEDIIYVIYTSGSTGMPKGVKICRGALNKFLEWSIPTYDANKEDIWAQFSDLSFDLSIVDIFTALCSGSTLLSINDRSSKLRPSNSIDHNRISIWHSIPSAVDFMIKNEKSREADLSSLKLMSFCGEPLRSYHLEFLFSKNPDLVVFNTYGPTEGTLFCTYQKFSKSDYLNFDKGSMSIGSPIPGWNLRLEPIDKTGEKELVIYGDFIGRGYVSAPQLDSFSIAKIGDVEYRSFHTGDLVIEHERQLYFNRRNDKQVKIKGYRIELEEVDYWNRKFFNCQSVSVTIGNSIHSFLESENQIDEIKARAFLQKKLENYKIPTAFHPVKELPRNSNFKIDRQALIELLK